MPDGTRVTIALPNKGRLHDNTVAFLEKCALKVKRDNARQYQSTMSGAGGPVDVVFQRARDIPTIVAEGKADLGITGFDIFCETEREGGECIAVFPDEKERGAQSIGPLPFGACNLVVAVPDHWVDVTAMADVAELALAMKKDGNQRLRVATEFPNLVRNFLFEKGVSNFQIVEVYGAAESAPKMGSADIVADLASSGVTLAENRLKQIRGGEILRSSACLIASRKLREGGQGGGGKGAGKKLALVRNIVDRIDANMKARQYWLVTANVAAPAPGKGEAFEDVLARALADGLTDDQRALLGRRGPTVARVLDMSGNGGSDESGGNEAVYGVSLQVEADALDAVVGILRRQTGLDILVSPVAFAYESRAVAYDLLKAKLKKKAGGD